jgi:hypothetical protein
MNITVNPSNPSNDLTISKLPAKMIFCWSNVWYLKVYPITNDHGTIKDCVELKGGRIAHFGDTDKAERVLKYGESITLEV